RRLPSWEIRVAEGGTEVPHGPTGDRDVIRPGAGLRVRRAVTGGRVVAQVEMGEPRPEVVLQIIHERLSGQRSAQQHSDESHGSNCNSNASHVPSPNGAEVRSGGPPQPLGPKIENVYMNAPVKRN